MEWPPKSGRQMAFPEVDRADFFDVATATRKIKARQEALIEELARIVQA
jgi:predicted NUDIX family NTP pyrophosphohydrolase